MPSYYIHMNQGIVADLRHHSLCSGQFSSCAPIVFYNAASHIGGLYHLAGCDNLNEMSTDNLRVIANSVEPTVVYVLCGGGDVMQGILFRAHVDPVSNLIASLPKAPEIHDSFKEQSNFSSITVTEQAGDIHIERTYSMDNKLNTAAAIDALGGDIGFIGERNDDELAQWM